MKRIGILGGSFNPIHIGHLTIAEMVHEQLRLDRVIFIPSNCPPHKTRKNFACPEDRYHMVRLGIRGNPHFTQSDYEINRPGKSYSIETLKYLRAQYPEGTRFFFIIGGDLLPTLHTWRRIDELCKLVTFVSVNRPGFKEERSRIKVKSLSVPGLQTSSSYVRRRIAGGKTVKYIVPENVLAYIRKRGLYRASKLRKGTHGQSSKR